MKVVNAKNSFILHKIQLPEVRQMNKHISSKGVKMFFHHSDVMGKFKKVVKT